jgi:hypothetical protein
VKNIRHLTSLSRSIHNTRVERLWVDFTQAVGIKWKIFFEDLEWNHLLDPSRPSHIWLLHWLFLEAINDDVSAWINAWNSHKVSLKGEPDRSPRDMYLFGMVEHGPRGIQHLVTSPPLTDLDEANLENPATFGVDHEIMEDPALFHSFLEHNPGEHGHTDDRNPFDINGLPAILSEVICEVVNIPLPGNFVQQLQAGLLAIPGISFATQDMTVRRLLWQNSLQLCTDVFNMMER